MMREVSCDDGNGESTFEFVEGKIEGLSLEDEAGRTDILPSAIIPENQGADYNTPMITPSGKVHQAAPAPTQTTTSFSSPLSSTIPPSSNQAYSFMGESSLSIGQPALSAPQQSLIVNQPPLSVSQSFPPTGQYQQAAAFSAVSENMGLRNPVQSLYGMSSSQASAPQVVETQPVTMYSVPPGTSTAIEFPISEQQGYPSLSPNSSQDKGTFFGWIKDTMTSSEFLNKVAEKAKSSVDTMITTLDPQMKQYIHSGGDVDLIVASDKEAKVEGVRDAFQMVFGRASVRGLNSQANIAVQPVGFAAGLQGAEERIQHLQHSGLLHDQQPIIAIENFLIELSPERWYDIGCLVLHDPARNLKLHSYTLPMPVPIQAVQQAQDNTPSDYPLRWSGLAIPIGKVISHMYQIPHTNWHELLGSVSRKDAIYHAAKVIATQYKQNLR